MKDAGFVRVNLDEDAARVDDEFNRHDRASIFVSRNADDDELLVESQLLPGPQGVDINAGRSSDIHFAATHKRIDRVVFVAGSQEGGEGRRRARKGKTTTKARGMWFV